MFGLNTWGKSRSRLALAKKPTKCVGSAPFPKHNSKSVLESKLVTNLALLTDDKSKFRQWDMKMVNAFTQVRKGYGRAIEHVKELVDKGRDPDDARAGTTQERLSSTSRPTLADLVHAATQRENQDVDMSELSDDLSCLLVDKAQIG